MEIVNFLSDFFKNNYEMLLAALAATIALYSAVISRNSRNIAQKALSISEAQYRNSLESIEGELIDAERWTDGDENYFALQVKISNNSTHDNSLKDVNIDLTIVSNEFKKTIIKLPLSTELPASAPSKWKNLEFAKMPINIKSKSVFEGSFISKANKSLVMDKFIESTSLESQTLEGTALSVIAYNMKVTYEKNKS